MGYYIYKIRNTINNKCYIGLTGLSPEIRWAKHQAIHLKSQRWLYQAIRKYGIGIFELSTLDFVLTKENARELECFYIQLFDSEKQGYNMHGGGALGGNNKGKKASLQTKQKMSESAKKRPTHPNSVAMLRLLGTKRTQYGVSDSEKRRLAELNASRKLRIKDNLGRVYESLTDAAVKLGLYKTNISAVLRGKIRTTGGLTFELDKSA